MTPMAAPHLSHVLRALLPRGGSIPTHHTCPLTLSPPLPLLRCTPPSSLFSSLLPTLRTPSTYNFSPIFQTCTSTLLAPCFLFNSENEGSQKRQTGVMRPGIPGSPPPPK